VFPDEGPFTTKRLCRAIALRYAPAPGRAGEIATGDEEFDGRFLVRGPEDVVRALFDAETRRCALELLADPVPARDVVMDEAELAVQPPWALDASESQLFRRRVAALARRLKTPRDVARALADAMDREREPAARRLQFGALVRHHGEHPAALLAVREAGRDPDPELRLDAALAMGPAGDAILRALALDTTVDEAVAACAIVGLGARFSAVDAAAVLHATLTGARSTGALVPPLRKDVALACVAALGHSSGRAAEAALVDALACDDHDVCVEAAQALGRVGTVAAVTALQDVVQRQGGALRGAARQAVASIQSRVVGARGDVSLPDASGGEVSLSHGGEVSITPDARKPRGG
jgi:hypothetical protein